MTFQEYYTKTYNFFYWRYVEINSYMEISLSPFKKHPLSNDIVSSGNELGEHK